MTKRLFLFLFLFIVASYNSFAVQLSQNGTGQALIFPYYTVNGGFNTLIHLTNTTDNAKALNELRSRTSPCFVAGGWCRACRGVPRIPFCQTSIRLDKPGAIGYCTIVLVR